MGALGKTACSLSAGLAAVFLLILGVAAAQTPTPPSPPGVAPTVTATGGHAQVTLVWSIRTATGITGWEYQMKVGSGGSYSAWAPMHHAGAITRTWTTNGLLNGTEYFFRVRATNAGGSGPASNEVSATPTATPYAPAVTASAGREQVILAWPAARNDVITHWEYRQKTDGGSYGNWSGIPNSDATTTTHTVTGLTNGTKYFFQVRAASPFGAGAASGEVSATPAAVRVAPVLSPPTYDGIVSGSAIVKFSWTLPPDRLIIAWGFERKLQGAQDWDDWVGIGNDRATREEDLLVTLGRPYLYRYRAEYWNGLGPPSNEVFVYWEAPPSAPLLGATAGEGQVTLRWITSLSNPANRAALETSITHWEYQIKAGASGSYSDWKRIPGSNFSTRDHIVPGLASSTQYFFKLRAVSPFGEGAPSNEALATTPAASRPAPVLTSVTATNKRVYLTWSHAGTGPGDFIRDASEFTTWQVAFKAKTETFWQAYKCRSCSIDNRTLALTWTPINGVLTEIRIRALGKKSDDSDVQGAWSNIQTVVAKNTARPLLNFSKTSITIPEPGETATYTVALNDPAGRATFNLRSDSRKVSVDPTSLFFTSDNHNVPQEVTVTGLAGGVAIIRHSVAFAPEAGTVQVITRAVPAQPTNLEATAGDRQVTLSWDNPRDASITRWEYQQEDDSGQVSSWTTIPRSTASTTTYTVSSLNNGTEYTFKVRAVNVTGNGMASTTATATPESSAPLAPVLIYATSPNGYLKLNWTHAGTDADDFIGGAARFGSWEAGWRPKGGAVTDWFSDADWGGGAGCDANCRAEARTVSVNLGNVPDGTLLQVRVRATGFASDGVVVTGPWSNIRTVVSRNSAVSLLEISKPAITIKAVPGGTATYTVALKQPFEGDLRITSDTHKLSVSPPRLSFTADDYDVPQQVIVTALAGGTATVHHSFSGRIGSVPKAGAVQVTMQAVPAKPTGLDAVVGDRQIRLHWDNPRDASIIRWEYQRLQKEVIKVNFGLTVPTGNWIADGPWKVIAGSTASTTTHTISGLDNGTEYGFRIRAVNGNGNSNPSDGVIKTPKGVSSAPILTSATISSPSSITLTWSHAGTRAGDLVRGATGFLRWRVIYRIKGAEGSTGVPERYTGVACSPPSCTVSDRSFSFPLLLAGISDGTLIEVRGIRAEGSYGSTVLTGTFSNALTAVYRDKQAPLLKLSKDTIAITVPGGFETYAVTLSRARKGEVLIASDNPGAVRVSPALLRFNADNYNVPQEVTITAAAEGKAVINHAFRYDSPLISNLVASGVGQVAVTATTPPPAPAAPTVTAAPGDARVILTWADPGDDSITGWEYRQKEGISGTYGNWIPIANSDADTTSYTVTGLTNSQAYFFRVRAVNLTGNGAESSEVSVAPIPVPHRALVTADSGDTEVTLNWSDPEAGSISGWGSITGWEYQQKEGISGTYGNWIPIANSDADTTSHTVTGLTNSQAYFFRVRAVNPSGTGEASVEVTATPIAVPAVPTGVTATAGDTRVTLSWNDPEDNSITGWQYRQKEGPSGSYGGWTEIRGSRDTTTSHDVTGLTNDTQYFFQVRAINNGGASGASSEVSATPIQMTEVSAPSTLTVGEGAGNAEVTVTTEAAFGKSITFNVTYGGTSATGAGVPADGDYDNDAVTEVAFNGTDTQKTIAIPITDDTLDEDDETFTVTIALADSSTLPDGFVLGNATTTVTITDDDVLSTAWTLAADPVSVTESSGTTAIKVTATRSGTATATRPTTVTVSVAGGTATAGTDFSEVTDFDLTVAAGAASGEASFNLVVTTDSVDESDETVTIGGTLQGNSFTPATVTITDDDDPPALSIAAPAAVTEGDSGSADMTFTVTLDAASGRVVTVDYAVDATSTATADTDFTDLSVTLTFAAGETSKPITVAVTGDELDEADETVVLKLSNAGNASIGTATGTGTITDDDPAPALSIAAPAAVAEGDSSSTDMTFTVTLDAASGRTVTVDYGVDASSTATAGADFTDLSGTLSFAAGETSKTITVSVTGDELDENEEAVVLKLSNAGNATLGTATATGTITDDDASPALSIAAPPAVTEGDSGSADMTFTVTLDAASGRAVTVDYAVDATSTATANTDFTGGAGTLSFAPGATSTTITVTVAGDELDEDDERVVLKLSNEGNASITTATATGTITDDDASPVLAALTAQAVTVGEDVDITASATDGDGDTVTYVWTRKAGETAPPIPNGTALDEDQLTFTTTAPGTYTMTVTASDGNGNEDAGTVTITVTAASTVSLSIADVTAAEDGTFTFTVTAAPAPSSEVTFKYTVTAASGDTATADTDFTAVPTATAATVAANASSTTITVTVEDDELDEADETFTVTLSEPSSGVTLGDATATGTITDNDDPPALSIAAPAAVTEGDSGSSDMTFTVALDAASGRVVTVDYAVDATSTATADTDFTDLSGTLTFAAGETSKPITVAVTGDELDEADETVVLKLSNAGNATLGTATARGTITDDDPAPALSIAAPAAVAEGDSSSTDMTFTVTLDAASGRTVTVDYGVDATSTATANTDFTDLSGTLTFAAGETSKPITVAVTGDELDEADETVVLKLSNAGNASIGTATARGTITDDDVSPVLAALTNVTKKVGQEVSVTASATDGDGDTVSYVWRKTSGPALPDGTTLTAATLTFTPTAAGAYVMSVTADDGNGNEDTESVTITVESATAVSVPSTLTVGEGAGNAEVTVTTPAAFGQAITFNVTYGGASATGASVPADGDYDNDAVTEVAFNGTDTQKTIAIPITADTLDESNETFTVTIALADGSTLPDGFVLGNTTTTVTITDDDTLSTAWTLTADPGSVTEGSGTTAIKVTATRSGTATATRPTTVTVGVAGGTATAGTDFTEVTNFDITVAAGATSGEASFNLVVTTDSVDESDETVTIGGTLQGNSFTPATVTITDDDDPPALSIAAPAAVTEGDSGSADMTFTVTLDAASGREVTVDYAVDATSTAMADTDFTDLSGTLTFAAGETSKPITVAVTGDELDEADETVVLKLSNAGNASIGTATARGTITDDDASPVLAALTNVTKKVGQEVSVTASATDGDGDTVSYVWRKTSGPALPDGTTLTAATLTFTPTAAGAYVMSVTADDGNGNEDTESVTITVESATAVSVPSTLTVGEGAGNAEVTVTTPAAFGQAITFNVTYGGASATGASVPADGDYDNDAVTSVAFGDSDTQKTIAIPITDDMLEEADETFTVTIALADGSTLPGGFVLGNTTTTVTITDNDTAGVTVSATELTVAEGETGTYMVTLNTRPTGRVTVTPTSNAGTVATVSGALTFTTGTWSTAQTVTVSGVDNDVAGADGTATVTHAVAGYGSVSSAGNVTVTVTDDDTAGVTVSVSEVTVAEGATGTYTVQLNTRPAGSVTVTPTSNAGTVATVSGALTFTTGTWSTAQTVTVSGVDNDVDGAAGMATVSHGVAGYGAVTAASVTVTVTDNDTAGVTVSATELTVAEGETGTYTVTLDTQPTGSVTVTPTSNAGTVATVSGALTFTTGTWSTAQTVTVSGVDNDVDGDAGTATVTHGVTGYGSVSSAGNVTVTVTDDDTAGVTVTPTAVTVAEGATGTYTVVLDTRPAGSVTVTPTSSAVGVATVSGALTFTTGTWSTAQTVTVSGVDNDVDGDAGTATVTHGVTGYGSVSSAGNVTVTVTDDDTAGVTVTPMAVTVAEGATGTYTVTLDTRPAGSVTVTPTSSAVGVATVSGALTFTTGTWSTAQTVTVSGVDNDVDGDAGTATVTHGVTGYGSVTANSVTVTVTDNDTAGVTVTPTAVTVAEGETGTYTVQLNTRPAGSVTVTPTSSAVGVATVSGALTFTTGTWDTGQTVTVTGVDNAVDGEDGTATVTHGVAGYGSVMATSVTVTVTDDDTAGVTVSATEVTVVEGATGTYTVQLNTQPTGSVTVTPTSSAVGVATVSGALTFTTGTWSTAQTVTVTGVDNDVDGAAGMATVSHGVAGYGAVTAASVTVTVTDNDTAGVTVTPTAVTVAEGATGTYTVTLDTQPTGSVTVTPTSNAGTVATVSGALTFTTGTWSTAQTVTVSGVDNDVDGDAGTATVTHAVTGYGSVSSAGNVTVTVTDDDTAGVTVTPTAVTVVEGETGTYTVQLNTRPAGSVTVTPTSSAVGVATVSGALTFTTGTWATGQTVTVTGVDNAVDGEDGTATVTHGVAGYGSVMATSVTVTVTDDDTAGVTVSATEVTVVEGATGTYTVQLNTQPTGSVTVTPTSSAVGVATVSGALTFTTGTWSTAQTVTVTGVDNDVDGAAGMATVSHGVAGYGAVTAASVTVTVTDNDTAGVTVTPTAVTVAEGATGTYTVTLDTQPTGSVTVTPTSNAGTVATVSGALTFTTGTWSTAQTVTVSGVDNDVDGDAGTATVTHAVTGYGSVSSAGNVTVTVTDDDTAGVTVTPTAVTVVEGETGTYTVQLNTRPAGSVTVTPTSSAVGVATVSGALTFTTGTWATGQTVTVTGVDNAVAGADGTATVTHAVAGYGSVSTASSVTVTVTDNDTAGVTVTPTAVTVAEGETGTYTVQLNTRPAGSVTVTPTSSAVGVATVSGALTFTTGTWDTGQTVTVTGVDNAVDGEDGTATVTHGVAGYGSVMATSVTVTVTDDDTAGVTVSATEVTVVEGATGTYTVQLNTQPTGSVTVTPTSSAVGVATVSGALTFTTGTWSTAQTVTVTGVDNDVDGAAGMATVSHGVAGYGAVTAASVTVTVTDNDTAGVTVTPTAVTVAEGATGTYTVTLDTQPTGSVTVTPTSNAGTVATVSGALTFTTGTWSTAQTVTVSGVDNDVDGDAGTATVTHAVTGYGSVSSAGNVTVTVTDDDTAGVTVTPTAVTVVEGETGTYTVQLNTRPAGSVTVTPTSSAVGVATVSGALTFTTGTWDTGQTVTVTGVDNAVDGEDGTATVTHGVAGYGSVMATSVTVTVTDDDTAGVTVSATEVTVVEGATGTYTVQLNTQPTGSVTVTPTSSAVGVATVSGALTFTTGTWSTAQTVTVTGVDNDVDGAAGMATVSHGVAGYGAVTAASVTVTVTDNDTAGVTVTPTAVTVAEGATGTYTVTLDTQPTGSVTVTPTSNAGTVATVSGALTFTTGTWSTAQTVTVSGVDNDVDGDAGTATVTHAVTGYGSVSSAGNVTVTVTDDDTAGVTVTPTAVTVVEGETGTYTVQLNTRPAGSVTVTPTSSAVGVATVSGALTFTTGTWATGQTVTVTGVDNAVAGADGTATVTHAVAGYGSVSTASSVTVTVTDNDTAGVTVTPTAVTVAEGETGTYTVQLNTRPAGSVTVTPTSSAVGVATVSGALTFTTGTWATGQTVTVTGVDNAVDGEDGTATVTHGVAGYGSVMATSVTVTVTDDDTAGVTVSATEVTVVEGATGTYTVQLNTQPTGSVTVTPTSNAGTVATVSGALTFTTGTWSTAQTVTVTGVDNDVDGAAGMATVSHGVAGYGSVTAASVTVTVTDNDTAGVTVSATELTVAEGETGTYTVTLDTQPTGSVTVTPTSNAGTVATVSGALTFTTGTWSTAQTVTVSGVDNDVDGDAGTATVTHGVTGYGSVSSAGNVTVTVTDDDTAGVTVTPTAVTVAEGATGTYTVVLDTRPAGSVTVTPTSSAVGVATVSGALTFTTGTWSTAQTVTVSGVDNDVDGDAGTATVTHGVTGYGSVSSAGNVTVTVTDDDTAGVTVTPMAVTVAEGATGTYTVTLDTRPAGSVTVTPTSSAVGVATVSGALTFTTGTWSTAQTVTVSGVDNDVDGDAGTATVTHTVTGYGSVTANSVTVTVTDNDTAGVTVTPTAVTVAEGETGTYTVQLNTRPAGSVTVTPTSSAVGVATVSGALTFTTGTWATGQTVTVTGVDNAVDGEDGTATVTHAVAGYGSVSTASSVTVTVTDNDTAGVTVTPTAVTVAEGETGTYTVQLNTRPAGSVTVTPTSSAVGVATVSGVLTFTTGTWGTAQTVTVSGVDNDVDGDAGTATVTHGVTGYGSVSSAGNVTVTVTDDDTAGVTVSVSELTVAEGATGTYTVVLDTRPVDSVTVTPTSSAVGVATVSGALTFTTGTWSTGQTVTVSGVDNAVDGAAGTGTVTHAVAGYGSVSSAGNVTVTVTDDDTAGVTVSTSEVTVAEGETGTYTVTLNTRPAGSVTVTPTSSAVGVATLSGALTFTTGTWATAQTVTVTGVDNAVDGDAGTATVTHGVAGYGSVSSAGNVTVTVTDDDTAGVTVTPTAVTVAEGATGTYTVQLNTRPAGSVTVTPTSSAVGVATVSGALTFTTGTWGTGQTVTVSGVADDDSADDVATVTHGVTGYGSVRSAAMVTVTVTDDDPGVTVSAAELTVAEGRSGSYTVVLDEQPSARVTITVGGASGEVTVSPTLLTFSTGNWDNAQTVTVSAGADEDAVDDRATLTHSAMGGGYASVLIASVRVMVTDDAAPVPAKPAQLTATPGDGQVALAWADAGDASITGWQVRQQVGAGSDGTWTAIPGAGASTTSHLVTGLSNGTAYTFQVRAVNRTGAGAASDAVTATPRDDEGSANAVHRTVLPQVAAAVVAESLGVVADRIEAVAGGTAGGSLRLGSLPMAPGPVGPGGRRPVAGPGPSLAEVLNGVAFTLPLGSGEDGGLPPLSVWGRGNRVAVAGSEDTVSWDGGLWGAHLGADLRLRPDLLAGVAVSYSLGELDAEHTGPTRTMTSTYETDLTAVQPYVAWLGADGSSLWASAGYGWGEVQLEELGRAARQTDLTFASTAVGGRGVLGSDAEWIAGGMTRLAIKGEGSLAWMETEAGAGLAGLAVDTRRLRLALQGSHERAVAGEATLTPAVEVGLRHDGGDATQGAGMEAGASLRYRDPGLGLTVEVRTRTLLVHERDREEWGVSGLVRLDPAADGQGLFLTLAPERGGMASGLGQLFERNPGVALAPGGGPVASRLAAELGHGFGVTGWGRRAVVTPYAGVTLVERGERHWRLGTRYRVGGLELSLEAARRASRTTPAADSLMIQAGLRW